jgi:archaellum component FlaF (FlaF/FlaG flagellin family)
MGSMAGLRTRWAAIGAACAVVLGAGGLGVVSATTSSGDRAIYVPVTQIRVLDTRLGEKVVNETVRLVIEGIITTADGTSQQVVPTDASAVAINITATSTRKNGDYGYVNVFPCTANSDSAPNTSSLNFENGIDIANALNVTTSANGSICLYVFGTADLLVDVAGYYVDHNHDDRYYLKADVDAALSGFESALAGKVDSVDFEGVLVDIATVLEGKEDSVDVDAALSVIESALAGKVGRCADLLICVVGDTGPGGGIVFYDAGSTQPWGRYLEAACVGWQNDCDGTTVDPLVEWGCSGTLITGADGTAIGAGEQNTTDLVANVGGCPTTGIAAHLANDLFLGGQTDWFLPSKDELNEMFTNLHSPVTPLGGFSTDVFYLSSSEDDDASAFAQRFDDGVQDNRSKGTTYYVRPVRAFDVIVE